MRNEDRIILLIYTALASVTFGLWLENVMAALFLNLLVSAIIILAETISEK